jgi:hypothetical protein
MSKVYAGLLVVVALFAMAMLGTLILVAITDVSYLASPTLAVLYPHLAPFGLIRKMWPILIGSVRIYG